MTEKKIKEKIREAINSNTTLRLRPVTISAVTSDIFKTLNEEGVIKVTKQKLLKTEMLIVVNDDLEDMVHEVHDALSENIENVEGVAAIRITGTMNMEGEFDEMPLYDDGDIWHELGEMS